MAKVEIKNVKSALNALFKLTDSSIKKSLKEISKFAKDRVKSQTRSGKDISGGTPEPDGAKRQKALSPAYIRFRKKIAKGEIEVRPKVEKAYFKPGTSNLNLTGQLLDSVYSKVRRSTRTVDIGVRGRHKKTRFFNKKTGKEIKFGKSQALTNSDLVRELKSRGRTFLGIDDKGVKRIRRIVLDQLRRDLKKRK